MKKDNLDKLPRNSKYQIYQMVHMCRTLQCFGNCLVKFLKISEMPRITFIVVFTLCNQTHGQLPNKKYSYIVN